MLRRLVIGIAGILAAGCAAAIAIAQEPAATEFVPTPGAEFQLNLYPITKFRGSPVVLKGSNPKIVRALPVESLFITRGIWELCSDNNYRGRCVRVSGSQMGIAVAIVTRSARLIGDTGPTFIEAPTSRAGSDVPMAPRGAVSEIARPAPAPVVAPTVAQGGEPGDNPSMKGEKVEFFPAPARNGLRVLACAQGQANPRCAQAAADGFCAERGYKDSGWREMITVRDRVYLSNVLCKTAEDSAGARENGGLRIPFFGS